MRTETATNTKLHFGRVLENSLVEPTIIEKSGRKVAVLLSFEEYQRISALEDCYWLARAQEAHNEGFIGAEAGEKLIQELLHAED
jgi:antitoxin Phd